ncbi:hypothetical protein HOK51_09240 [Candidatus Woesearchaeota archaeon]|jgi:hypothetical protein|nr:hypothetical protein [Candidatus Woesearchaeota archaeon]MBT6520014.1 hypothetical protein [Candidatus Woesearchaeota archaeon]MBT7367739.1 hypothetical protein [Candidatus Woesearchaeota archaeon]
MGKAIDFFNSTSYLEPKCPNCGIKIEWGITTEFCDEKETQVCSKCKTVLEEIH